MRKSVLLFGALCSLSFAPFVAMAEGPTSSQLDAQKAWDSQYKKFILDNLRDPDSAKFECVNVTAGDPELTMITLAINSKNAFGGYTGTQCFIYVSRMEFLGLQEDPACLCRKSDTFRVSNP